MAAWMESEKAALKAQMRVGQTDWYSVVNLELSMADHLDCSKADLTASNWVGHWECSMAGW